MAEFQEVMRQAYRLCEIGMRGQPCEKCPIYVPRNGCGMTISSTMDREDVETAVMKWAEEHPEPKYPSWKEWHTANFPDAHSGCICPRHFLTLERTGCKSPPKCDECINKPIPEDVAKKLGITLDEE